jgi:hypothetical protein
VGPTGPTGPTGPAGPQGPAGADAIQTCGQCHGHDAALLAIEWQFRNSAHYETVYYYREGACMACHNHQGFITTAVEGQPLPANFNNPAPINCRTCHKIHDTFTDVDYALTTTAPVNLLVGGATYDDPSPTKAGNLCANCHQARDYSPKPTIGGANVTIGNFRYGPHYATQANVMVGRGLYHFPGSAPYPADPAGINPHYQACSTCHLQPTSGHQTNVAGGHTFKLSYMDGTQRREFITACTGCHRSAVSFNHFTARSTTQVQLNTLKQLLIDEGIMREDGYANTGSFPADVVAAFMNWKFFYYDGSYGSHNPGYVRAVLTNTIEAMQARRP